MNNMLHIVDTISIWTAKIVKWLSVILVLILSFEVVMRYVFNSPTMWVMQSAMMIGGTLIVLGWSFVLQQQGHVRVDIFYGKLEAKGKAIVNLVGAILILFPFIGLLAYEAAVQTLFSFRMHETMPETAWYPPVYPIRAIVFFGLALFLVQGIAQFIRDVRVLMDKGEAS